MKRLLFIIILLAPAGCGTIAGIGQDISTGARAVERMF